MLTVNVEGELVYDYEPTVPELAIVHRVEDQPITATLIDEEPCFEGFATIVHASADAMRTVLTEDLL